MMSLTIVKIAHLIEELLSLSSISDEISNTTISRLPHRFYQYLRISVISQSMKD